MRRAVLLLLGLLFVFHSCSGNSYSISKVNRAFCDDRDLGCGSPGGPSSEKDCCLENNNGRIRYRCCNLDWVIGVAVGVPFFLIIVIFSSVGFGLCCCFYCAHKKRRTFQSTTITTTTTTGQFSEPTGLESEMNLVDPPPSSSYKWSLEKKDTSDQPPSYTEAIDSEKF